MFSGVQVDGGDPLVRRLDQRESPGAWHRDRPRIAKVAHRSGRWVFNEINCSESGLRRDKEPPCLWIDCRPWPVHAATRSRHLDEWFVLSSDSRGSEERGESSPFSDLQCFSPQLWGEVDQVVLRDSLQIKGRWLCGERLRGRIPLARYVTYRHGSLLDRPDRLAGDTVEHVSKSLLARLRQCFDLPSINDDVE